MCVEYAAQIDKDVLYVYEVSLWQREISQFYMCEDLGAGFIRLWPSIKRLKLIRGPFQDRVLFIGKVLAGSVDIEVEHRHGRGEGHGLTAFAVVRGLFE
jgi:hypothetical protein